MCSNAGNNACGCDTGANNGASIWSSGLKKQIKRPRVPKRGPGVAELEKILREQATIDISDRKNVEGLSPSSCFIPHHHSNNPYHSSSLKPHQPPPTSSIPPPGPPPSSNMPGLVLPEQQLFPMNLTSCKSKSNLNEGLDGSQSDSGNSSSRNLSSESNPIWSYPATIQKRTNQYPTPMVNQFLGAGNPTSSGSLPIGLHNHVEPPSNQSSHYNYPSRHLEEHKMVSMKQPHPSSLDNSLIPPSNFQVAPSFSHFSRPHQSSKNDTQGASGFPSTNECYRDAKWGSTLELNGRKFISDSGVPGHANFSSFATPEVPPPPIHLFRSDLSKGNVLPYQVTEDRMEDSYQPSQSSGSEHKPFFNFLDVEDERVKETRRPNHGGHEANGGIDLNLKL